MNEEKFRKSLNKIEKHFKKLTVEELEDNIKKNNILDYDYQFDTVFNPK